MVIPDPTALEIWELNFAFCCFLEKLSKWRFSGAKGAVGTFKLLNHYKSRWLLKHTEVLIAFGRFRRVGGNVPSLAVESL